MVSFSKVSRFRLTSFLGASTLLIGAAMSVPAPVNAQPVNAQPVNAQPVNAQPVNAQSNTPSGSLVISQAEPAADNTLGIAAGNQLMQEAEQAIAAQNYPLAASKLQAAREIFNEFSTAYQQLTTIFTGVDSDIASSMRQQALTTAVLRDQASYQQALVYRAQSQPELAVPLLVQIIESQGPSRDLGLKAYAQLFELGFVQRAYSRTGSTADTTTPATAVRPLSQSDSPLGIGVGTALMTEAEQASARQDYDLAASKLQAARESLNEVSGYYQQLVNVFSGIDRRIIDDVREQALAAAQLRDQATYQQALVYRTQNRPDLAVPLLVEVLQSQNPTRELGQQAYQQLLEIDFVDLAYPRSPESAVQP